MRNQNEELYDQDGDPNPEARDYGPNELAELSLTDPDKYRRIVESNLDANDTVEAWQDRNRERALDDLARQRLNRKNY